MIVGISGKAGSGKNEVGAILASHSIKQMAFADALKDTVKNLFFLSEAQVSTQEGKAAYDPRYGQTPRQILQAVGVALRSVEEDVWVNYVLKAAEGFQHVVVTDLRFPNEAEAIVRAGGLVVRVERPGLALIAEASHTSEVALDLYPFRLTVVNDGTLDDLRKKVETQLLPLLTR